MKFEVFSLDFFSWKRQKLMVTMDRCYQGNTHTGLLFFFKSLFQMSCVWYKVSLNFKVSLNLGSNMSESSAILLGLFCFMSDIFDRLAYIQCL